MEQLLEAFGIDWRLLIAQAVNFAIVLVALNYFLYKPVMGMLEKRRALVAQGVADADSAAQKLAHADEMTNEKLSTAEREAEQIVATARESATDEKDRIVKDAQERAEAVARDAEARATDLAARAKQESEKEIARLAVLAAEKLMQKHHD